MNRVFQLTFISSLLLTVSSIVFADVSKTVTYKNQRGSTLNVVWSADKDNAGTLTGTFTTAVSKCKAALGKAVPVAGVYNGNAIALIVNYPECGSVLAMSGNFDKDRSDMNLHWFLTRQGEVSPHETWDTTSIGVDQYKKQP